MIHTIIGTVPNATNVARRARARIEQLVFKGTAQATACHMPHVATYTRSNGAGAVALGISVMAITTITKLTHADQLFHA